MRAGNTVWHFLHNAERMDEWSGRERDFFKAEFLERVVESNRRAFNVTLNACSFGKRQKQLWIIFHLLCWLSILFYCCYVKEGIIHRSKIQSGMYRYSGSWYLTSLWQASSSNSSKAIQQNPYLKLTTYYIKTKIKFSLNFEGACSPYISL